LIWEVVERNQQSQNSNISHLFIQSQPIINFSQECQEDQLQHHVQSKFEISQVFYWKLLIKELLHPIPKIINWKEIMKFILHHLEHSLLLLFLTKTKQPPIYHLPNLKNKKSQDEEEFFHTKISKISSNQLIIKPNL